MKKTTILAGIIMCAAQFIYAESELKPIFNGKDFEGWTLPGNNIWWSVEDGSIKCKNDSTKKGSILWTEKKYRNFIVELDFKMGEGSIDSGLFIRTENQQAQIGISGSLKRDMTCSIYIPGKGYPVEAEGVKDLLKIKDWNTMRVKAVGNEYTMTLNGKEVLVYKDQTGTAVEEGPLGFQLHPGKVMSIEFRNIKILEL